MTVQINKLLDKKGNLPVSLTRLLVDAAGILWRMRRFDRRIEFLNDAKRDGVTSLSDLQRLLTDLVYARKVVREDDFFRFKIAIKSIREWQPTSALFRLCNKEGQFHWFKVAGVPCEVDQNFYYGFFQDITTDVMQINRLLEKDLTRQTMLQQMEFPALLVDMKNKTIISRNIHANRFFGYDFEEFNRLTLRELYPAKNESEFVKAYETCLLEGVWEGPLQLKIKNEDIPPVIVRLKRLAVHDMNLLRISIPEILSEEGGENTPVTPPLEKEFFMQKLMTALDDSETIYDILSGLKAVSYGSFKIEALLHVELNGPKKKILISAVGDPFSSSDFSGYDNFEGLVMQDIRERRVEHVILKDTMESTRPIDWAFFIPYGIRSYYVKPFFVGSKLRTLLFLCSTEVNAFSEGRREIYEIYCSVFLKALRKWRKRPLLKPAKIDKQ